MAGVLIGNLGSDRRAQVLGGGQLIAKGYTIEWWVGAGDRWHVPAQAITCRQSLVGDAPVVQTVVRVLGGDVKATAYACRQGRRDLVVLEIENTTAAPCALAVVVSGGRARVDGRVITVDGEPLVVLSGAPHEVWCATDRAALLGSAALLDRGQPAEAPQEASSSAVAAIVPLIHRSKTSVAVVLDDDSAAALPVINALPDGDTVARGWATQRRRGIEVDLPDPALASRLAAATGALLLWADALGPDAPLATIAAAAVALARSGFTNEAHALAGRNLEQQGRRGGFSSDELDRESATAMAAWALAESVRTRNTDDEWPSGSGPSKEAWAAALAGALERLARDGRRDGRRDAARDPATSARRWGGVLAIGAGALAVLNEPEAARAARRVWASWGRPVRLPSPPLDPLPAMSPGGSLVADDPRRLAVEQLIRLDGLASDGWDGSDGGIDLLGAYSSSWNGASIDVRRLPVAGRALSFSVRWHGERPAVLWEATGAGPISLRWRTWDPGMIVRGASRGEHLCRSNSGNASSAR